MKSRRTIGIALAAISGLVAMAACSSPAPTQTSVSTPPSQSQPAGDATITYWHAYSADSQEITVLEKTVIPAFEAANPGVKVTSVPVPYDDLHQKLVTGIAGGELPDVVRSDIIWVPELANLGVLEPLDTAMGDFQAISQAVYPGPLATNKWKDHYYGLPLDTNTLVMLNNPAAFDKAGVKMPSTLKEFAGLADTFKAKDVALYADGNLNGWNVLPFIWSFGEDIVSPDVTKATGILHGPQSVAAIQALYALYRPGAIPAFVTQDGATDPADGFSQAKYATMMGGPWMYPILEGSFPDLKFEATMLPAGDGGSISVVGGEDIVMTSASKNKEAAAKFISYLLGEETQKEFAKIGQMPVLSSLAGDLTAIQPYYATFSEQLKTAKPRPATPAWTEMDTRLEAALQELFLGGGDVRKTLDSLAAEFDGLLAQYQ
ncbi:MAG: extracellular solute-binding protein [Propionibacteriaceae bacterium]|nr:extracellular solute-binding protein [Propionibacteriaceae bacterium]